ncbi:MAG: hypothetical protein QOF14_5364 [Hyphomicrobiales bacterium]|jgi:hypothetical protein|nr:hypothetical protein [Hyphomicrobiales bacterium]
MAEVTDWERFDFEREKWRADLDIRGREVALKEHEQASSKWRSPIVVAILAAAAAAAGNAIVAVVNGHQQVTLENSKAESARILEMIKTGDTERAASNMDFLLKSGLVTDETRAARLAQFLKDREPGTGPSLPAATAPISFEPAEALTKPVQDRLQKSLDAYVAYLGKVGFAPAGGAVKITVDKQTDTNTTYSQDTKVLTIGEKILGDVGAALQTYTYHVLASAKSKGPDRSDLVLASLEIGLADYFTCSFLKNPKLGEIAAKAIDPSRPFLRTLENDRKFSELQNMRDLPGKEDVYGKADVWGGLFWAIRQKIGQEEADAAIANAWRTVIWPSTKSDRVSAFLGTILSSLKAKGAAVGATEVETLFKSRGFPTPKV